MTDGEVVVSSSELRSIVAEMLASLGLPLPSAELVAESLVGADEEGISSHGVMLLPMYLERMRNGSVSLLSEGRVVHDRDAVAVIDGDHSLGQLTAHQAVNIAAAKAKTHGLGAVAVRNAFHFGAAGRYAIELANRGCIGVASCNTRPLMPAPGGAEAIVGNNPLAISMPSEDNGPPLVLDMATSASAMGKIRMAATTGQEIPADWATDSGGRPTTDPAAAIKGMLLPAGGPKGFGLALMIDLLCGGLSSGAVGAGVRTLYGDSAVPYRCAHFFLAIHIDHFLDSESFRGVVAAETERLRSSRRAPGIDRVMAPGEPEWRARKESGGKCTLQRKVYDAVLAQAKDLGVAHDVEVRGD